MNEIFVDHFAYVLGEQKQTLSQAVSAGRTLSGETVLREAGFEQHHICCSETTAFDLARACTAKLGDELRDIGAIIYATCLPHNATLGNDKQFADTKDVKTFMNYAGSHLQADFGLDGAAVIGLSQQACTGMLGAVDIARMMLMTRPEMERVLCITADRFPDDALYEQSYNLISDGAAACIASRVPGGFRILANSTITNGGMARASDEETAAFYFNYTYRTIQDVLHRAGHGIDEVAWIVPQNTHRTAWAILARLLGVSQQRIYAPTIGKIGHMIGGDNIANLKSLLDSGNMKTGDLVLLTVAGYGLNWHSMMLQRV